MKNLVWQMETVAKAEHTLDYDKLGEVAAYQDVMKNQVLKAWKHVRVEAVNPLWIVPMKNQSVRL